MNLNDPVATALFVADVLERAGHRHALMGGLLMAAYGEPRETNDADLVVVDLTVEQARAALEAAGLVCRIAAPDAAVAFGGLTVGRVSLIGGEGCTGLNVLDLVRARSARYNAAAMDRSIRAPLRDRSIQALSPEDFVLFKALANRDSDLDDAASVVRVSAEVIDFALIDREAAALALEEPRWNVAERWATIRSRAGR